MSIKVKDIPGLMLEKKFWVGKAHDKQSTTMEHRESYNQALDEQGEVEIELNVDSIEKIIEDLAYNQHEATIKAVQKKGLMKTNWSDIDAEGGVLNFRIIAQALSANLLKILKVKGK